MIDFIFNVQNNTIVITAAGNVQASSLILNEISKKIQSSILAKSTGIYTSSFSLKINLMDIDLFLLNANKEIKNLSLKDFLNNGFYFKFSEFQSFLKKEVYDSLINELKKADSPWADKIRIPKKARFYDQIEDMLFSYLQLEEKYHPSGKVYSRRYPEVEFLFDCLLNLEQDIDGNLYCNPNNCLSYLKYYKGQENNLKFSEEITYLLKAIDPELTLLSSDNLHEKFCFTSTGSRKLKDLLTSRNCMDIIIFEQEDQNLLGDTKLKLIERIEKVMTSSLSLQTRLEKTSGTNTAYTNARDLASVFHRTLAAAFEKFKEETSRANTEKDLKTSITEFTSTSCQACKSIASELSKHRGLWYSLHPLIREILGVIATLTMIPGLVVSVVSPHGYMETFFRLPATNSLQLMNEIQDEIEAVNVSLAIPQTGAL